MAENTDEKLQIDCGYKLAKNILIDDDKVTLCVQNALNSMQSKSSVYSTLHLIRRVRDLAINDYMANRANEVLYSEIAQILGELGECIANTSGLNKEENVVALQLSDIIDDFARSLPELDCNIFIRRYFFVESINSIATKYNKTEDTISSILFKCRTKLATFIVAKGYIIKIDTLFNCFTDISDNLLELSEHPSSAKKNRWVIPVSISSGILVLIAALTITIITITSDKPTNDTGLPSIQEYPFDDPEDLTIVFKPIYINDGKVNLDGLLLCIENDASFLPTTLECSFSYASEYTLFYEECGYIDQDILKECTSEITVHGMGTENDPIEYYFLNGIYNAEYIVTIENGKYTLWRYKTAHADTERKDQYQFILSNVYGLSTADSINRISFIDNNTNDNISMEMVTTNYSDISYIYYVLSIMSCDNSIQWDLLEDTSSSYEQVHRDSYKVIMTTTDGRILEGLYYSPAEWRFYTEGGFAFDKISENAYKKLNEILGFDEISTGNIEFGGDVNE